MTDTELTSFYLGPDSGRWIPGSWDAVAQAAKDGLLDETFWVELKEKLNTGPKSSLDYACDLASLGLDGGLFVVGIAEQSKAKGKAGEVVGCEDLPGLADRLVQIARDRIHPPLYVDPREVHDPARPGTGCLLVSVPASGMAPHMADDRYWGRNSIGKQSLTDPQVRERLARRRDQEDAFTTRLRTLADRDPWAAPHDHGHLYVLAAPVAPHPEALVTFFEDPTAQTQLWTMLQQLAMTRPGESNETNPHPIAAASWIRHDRGRALTNVPVFPCDILEHRVIHRQLDEDGTVTVISGQGADTGKGRSWTADQASPERPLVDSGYLLGIVHDAVGLAGRIADGHGTYQGLWNIGIRIDHLRGAVAAEHVYRQIPMNPMFLPAHSSEIYEKVTTASTAEMVTQPWVIAERLIARLVRALGTEKTHLPYKPADIQGTSEPQ